MYCTKFFLGMVAVLIGSLASAGAQSCPVVDFGDDLAWWCSSIPEYRWGQELKLVRDAADETTSRFGHSFSLTVPLSPNVSEYNTRGNNTRFYGGMKTLSYNSPKPAADDKEGFKLWSNHWTEGGINMDHDGFDDFNHMGYGLRSKDNYMRAFGVWIWKKEDFINGGDKHPVSFDAQSRVGVYLSRTYPVSKEHAQEQNDTRKGGPIVGPFNDTYANSRVADFPRELWKGWEFVDILVQDGDQFYMAQTEFRPRQQTLFEISPTQVKWAKFNPKEPWDFEWDRTKATFEEHSFKDVRAVGWMISKPSTQVLTTLWLKWYAFGMDAVVQRPPVTSWNVPMVSAGVSGLQIAQEPVTYEQWIKVYRWGTRNQYALHHGYNFHKDGTPGSSWVDDAEHSTAEPVTGISWQDAALWCNALSEYEGKTPCYYEDAELTKILRSAKDRASEATMDQVPAIYLKPDANGFRLPTPTEVTKSKAQMDNSKLWHFVWDVEGIAFTSEKRNLITVLGGDSASKPEVAKLPFGEIPSRGHHAIGFRPVCAGKGFKFEASSFKSEKAGVWAIDGMPAWSFAEGQVIAPAALAKAVPPAIETVKVGALDAGKTEVSFAQWRKVWNWGEMHGYRFDYDGDMGSLKWDDKTEKHSPQEPVTAVAIADAMVWCNALSEMSGLKPVYYSDKELTQVMKVVHPVRAMALPNKTTTHHPPAGWPKLAGFLSGRVFNDPAATGYRLPTNDEWTQLAGSGLYPSGATLDLETAWMIENSGQKTQPVGTKKPTGAGLHDLAGNVFEWTVEVKGKDGKYTTTQAARGGSHRSDNKVGHTPLKTAKIATNAAFGGGIVNTGTANAEVGFRVVKNSGGGL